jgi:hypothetical protein
MNQVQRQKNCRDPEKHIKEISEKLAHCVLENFCLKLTISAIIAVSVATPQVYVHPGFTKRKSLRRCSLWCE